MQLLILGYTVPDHYIKVGTMGQVIKKEQCPECARLGGDKANDNLAIYQDGSSYCFACNETRDKGWALLGTHKALNKRLITQETCEFADYQVGKYTGYIHGLNNVETLSVHIANYYGAKHKLLRQKLRTANKAMVMLGPKGVDVPLYGQWLWEPNDKLFVTIVEGEIDMLTVLQVQGTQYPVVSLSKGAGGAVADIKRAAKWLMGWKYVILAFDNDEAGNEAALKVLEADILDPTMVRIAKWPLKDEITRVLFNAKSEKPDPLVTISDIREKILTQPKFGTSYPYKSMTQITYGFQPKQVHIIVAATGIGKTEFVKELMFHFLSENMEVGLFSFEQTPDDTMRRLIGAKLGLKLHLPGAVWNEAEIIKEMEKFDKKIYLCDRTGSIKLDELFLYIKYLAKACNKKIFFIDNLKGLGLGYDAELSSLFMRKLQTIVRELNISVFILSHVSKSQMAKQVYVTTSPKNPNYKDMSAEETQGMIEKDGMNWETGRMPTTETVEGHSVICDLADYVWGLARNKNSEAYEESHTTKVKLLKARLDGEYTGKSFKLYYNKEGRLVESEGMQGQEISAFNNSQSEF